MKEKIYAKWFCEGDIREAQAQMLTKRGDGLLMDWTQLRLGYRLGMCSMGLYLGTIREGRAFDWRAFCISSVQGLFWFNSLALVLGVVGLYMDKIQDQLYLSLRL